MRGNGDFLFSVYTFRCRVCLPRKYDPSNPSSADVHISSVTEIFGDSRSAKYKIVQKGKLEGRTKNKRIWGVNCVRKFEKILGKRVERAKIAGSADGSIGKFDHEIVFLDRKKFLAKFLRPSSRLSSQKGPNIFDSIF